MSAIKRQSATNSVKVRQRMPMSVTKRQSATTNRVKVRQSTTLSVCFHPWHRPRLAHLE
jgi:hypothetical protein